MFKKLIASVVLVAAMSGVSVAAKADMMTRHMHERMMHHRMMHHDRMMMHHDHMMMHHDHMRHEM